jgi:uncharacterized integral membrane protein
MSTAPPPPEAPEGPPPTGTEVPAEPGGASPVADGTTQPTPGESGHQLVVPSTRTSGTWTGIGIGLFVLVLVIIFIGQNTKNAPINFLWMHGSFPVGVAVLAAFVLGGIVVLLLGVARLAQLRLLARRHRKGST